MQKSLLTIGIILSLSGCAYLEPYVQDFNIVSVAQETQLSQQMAEQIAGEMRILESSKDLQKIKAIGQELVRALPYREFNYEFFVVEDKTPNAFTIPGGKIYVHTGLLDFVDSDDELAGVLAHEIGHAFERHPAKSLSRAYGVDYLTQLLFKKQANASKLKDVTLALAKGGLLSRYGRSDEHEADDLGVILVRLTNYNSEGLLSFLRKLESLEKPGSRPPAFLSTHPPTPERISRLEQISRPGNISTLPTQRY